MSLKSRSFLHRVNDRVRKMMDCSPEDIDERFMIWRMFMSSTLEASVFMRKNYADNLHSIKNPGEDITLKQMFDISEKLIVEQCWKNACMHDVHNTCPPSPMRHNHKGLALCSRCHPVWASEGTPVGPGKDTHGTLGPGKRGGCGWPTPTLQGRSTVSMTHAPDSTKHKSVRQTW